MDFGYGYLTTGRDLESTDDAYVKADSTIVSPKVSGYLADVLVGDNQAVKAGQLLARIDDRDFRTALDLVCFLDFQPAANSRTRAIPAISRRRAHRAG